MKKWLLRLKLEDEILIDTTKANNIHLAFASFINRNSMQLRGFDGAFIYSGISLINDGEDNEKMS